MTPSAFSVAVSAGRTLHSAGRYFEAHEAFEAGWRVCRGEEKRALQALVLWMAALHHRQTGNATGARRLLGRGLEKLVPLAGAVGELDVEWLHGALAHSLAEVDAAEHRPSDFPPAVVEVEASAALEHEAHCPSCGEPVLVTLAPEDLRAGRSIEDCPVCCHPWEIVVSREGSVALHHPDD